MPQPLTDFIDAFSGVWLACRGGGGRARRGVGPVAAPAPAPRAGRGPAGLGGRRHGAARLAPPPGPPTLEFYNLPVRLAAIVLAPVGRVRTLPSREDLPGVVDSIVPGLDRVAIAHKPLIRAWPAQVSARGFAHAFFQHVRLPGDHGKKTPWCSVAGRFMVDDQPMMAGLVLRAAAPNRHGQYVMEREEQWLGILRIRLDAS